MRARSALSPCAQPTQPRQLRQQQSAADGSGTALIVTGAFGSSAVS
jgi:hypothetical protein